MIAIVVEGPSDVQIGHAVARACGLDVVKVVVKKGKTNLDPDIPKYNQASKQIPWVVFRDSDSVCPVELSGQLLQPISKQSSRFVLCLAHSMSEAWLLADCDGFASYFHVAKAKIPREPELLSNAKATLLRLCSESRSREIRSGMVARSEKVGPLYVSTINHFATTTWDVDIAASRSPSLRRALERLKAI